MLFALGNRLLRSGHHHEALLVYKLLSLREPTFGPYSEWTSYTLRKMLRAHGRRPLLQTAGMSDYAFALKVADAIVCSGEHLTPQEEDVVRELAKDHREFMLFEANRLEVKTSDVWLKHFNAWLSRFGVAPALLIEDANAARHMDRLKFPAKADQGGELVSILMSAKNAATSIGRAIESILNQTYGELELIVIDDGSTDNTGDITDSYASKDCRVRVFRNRQSMGTYWNRNEGLRRARGVFFTIMDADDIAFPKRIAMQVDALADPKACATWGYWVRMNTEGQFLFKTAWQGGYLHPAIATFFFRRQRIVERIGYYDSVRVGGDMEFAERATKAFGSGSVILTDQALMLAHAGTDNLTAGPLGISSIWGSSEPRRAYTLAWKAWHKSTGAPFVPHPQKKRFFDVPEEILPPPDCNLQLGREEHA